MSIVQATQWSGSINHNRQYMRKYVLLFCLAIAALSAFSQSSQVMIDRYALPAENTAEKVIILEMSYAKYNISRMDGNVADLKNAGEIIIDVVFTDYPAGESFGELNKHRMDACMRALPLLNKSNIRKINYLRQQNSATREAAENMFHGIVVRYRPGQTAATMKHDLKKLDEMLMSAPVKTDTVAKKELLEEKLNYCGGAASTDNDFKRMMSTPMGLSADSFAIMTPAEAYRKGYLDSFSYYKDFKQYDSMLVYFCKRSDALHGDISGYNYKVRDSTVFNIFKRNHWKNIAIVGDVTGSMYPYTGQLLVWLKLHSLDSFTTQFAFFNDGDNKQDHEKIIGNTGGIYFKTCSTFKEVQDLVKTTMENGGGGDVPENNIEALLLAEKKFPESDFIVLIADNWANVKDKKLIDKLTKPVRVVLCGVDDYGINVDYLNLARKTKGSVHLIEGDLVELASLHEGEVLRIGKMKFRIENGEFKQIYDTPGLYPTL
jgi:hypothetical protein